MREDNEKECDCSVSRINTHRVGVQSEKNFFTQELSVDLNYVSRLFMDVCSNVAQQGDELQS